jgi:hypothetical protein
MCASQCIPALGNKEYTFVFGVSVPAARPEKVCHHWVVHFRIYKLRFLSQIVREI